MASSAELATYFIKQPRLTSAYIHEAQRNLKIKGEELDYGLTYNYHNPEDEGKLVAGTDDARYLYDAEQRLGYKPSGELGEIRNKVMNDSYGGYLGSDEYKALKGEYERQGSLASEDVMGKAASSTGGLASSYATTAASQQYNAYMQGLFERSYTNYLNEANANLQRLAALQDLENSNINLYQYQKSLAWNRELAEQERKEREQERKERDAANSRADARAQIEVILKNGGTVSEELWGASGYDASTRAAMEESAKKRTSGGGGYNNGSLSSEQIKELQRHYRVAADGYWGPKSKEAAGGLSADEAWKAYQEPSYNAVLENLAAMKKNGRSVKEVLQALEDAYKSGLISGEEYGILYDQYG